MRDTSCEPTELDVEFVLRVARATVRALGATDYEVDESAQCTVVKLWERWQHPNVTAAREAGPKRWYAYVKKTAQRTHYDLIRGHRRREERHNRAAGGRITPRAERPGCLLSGPEDAAGIDEWIVRQLIASEIRLLPTRQRQVASLFFLQELSIREIGERLQVQPQSVRKSLRAARQALRDRLAESQLESA